MKVAILGAGLAGLCCAHELERLGIRPVIYEKNSYIGDQLTHASVLLEIINRPIKDLIKYIYKEFAIDIKPLSTLNVLTHYSPNKKTVIRGNFGYLLKRGTDEDSVFCQILSQIKNPDLRLSEAPDPFLLSDEYDYVVISNGNPVFSEVLGCWQSWLNTYVRGAIIDGNFNTAELTVWINKTYCKRGYVYMTPLSEKRASLVLIVSDVNEKEVQKYWELFIDTENIKNKIVQEYTIEHRSGFSYPLAPGNFIFAGNAGGSIEPFLGFGQFSSIAMGVMAARSIALKKDYEELVKPIKKHNLRMLKFREFYDRLDNKSYDMLISTIGKPIIRQITYFTPLNVVKLGSKLFKLFPTKLP